MARRKREEDPAIAAHRAAVERLDHGRRGSANARLPEALAAVFDDSVERMRAVLEADTPLSWLLNRQRLGPIESEDVWESFVARGLVPVEWLGESRRLFGRGRLVQRFEWESPREDTSGRDPQHARAFPWDYVDAITFGANCDAMVSCETLVRDSARRNWTASTPAPDRVLWRCVERLGVYADASADALLSIADALDSDSLRAVNKQGVSVLAIHEDTLTLGIAPVH